MESQNEEIVSPTTPKDTKEKCMIEDLSSNTKVVTSASEFQKTYWRQKTRSKNKLRMNMKVVLYSKFKKKTLAIIEDSSSEEDPQIKNLEYTVDQTLGDIEKGLGSLPKVLEEDHNYKVKQKV